MVILNEISNLMDECLKVETAEPWDNVGLLVGDEKANIKKILIALELTKELLDYAKENNFNLIITHHPAIFKPIKNVVNKTNERNLIYELIKYNIALYSCHTNFDRLENAMDTHIGNILDGKNFKEIEDCEYGIRFEISHRTVEDIANELMKGLNLNDVRLIGKSSRVVSKVAVITGSGSDMYKEVEGSGAELFITGDIKYHSAQDYLNSNMEVLDIGHYGSEKSFPKVFLNKFGYLFKDLLIEEYCKSQDPFEVIIRR